MSRRSYIQDYTSLSSAAQVLFLGTKSASGLRLPQPLNPPGERSGRKAREQNREAIFPSASCASKRSVLSHEKFGGSYATKKETGRTSMYPLSLTKSQLCIPFNLPAGSLLRKKRPLLLQQLRSPHLLHHPKALRPDKPELSFCMRRRPDLHERPPALL